MQEKQLLARNPFYHDLADVMNHAPFRRFLSHHMKTWSDVETCLMYIKLWEMIESYVGGRTEEVLPVLHRIMTDQQARRHAVSLFRGYQGGSSLPDRPVPLLL